MVEIRRGARSEGQFTKGVKSAFKSSLTVCIRFKLVLQRTWPIWVGTKLFGWKTGNQIKHRIKSHSANNKTRSCKCCLPPHIRRIWFIWSVRKQTEPATVCAGSVRACKSLFVFVLFLYLHTHTQVYYIRMTPTHASSSHWTAVKCSIGLLCPFPLLCMHTI